MSSAATVLHRNGLALMVQAHPDSVYVCALDGTVIECNDNLLALAGCSRSELLATTFAAVQSECAELTGEHFRRAACGETTHYVTEVISTSGHECIVEVTNLPLRDDHGAIVGVLGIARDVGAARRRQELVERDQVSSRIAGKLAKFGGWSIEVPGGELFWSAELFELLKVEPGLAPPFEHAVHMYPEPHRQQLEAALESCMTAGEPIDLESVVRDGDGREFPVHIVAEAVRDGSGTIIRVQGAFQDITDLVADRDERLSLQTRLSETLDQIADGIYFVDRDWRFTFVNATGERYIGNPAAVLLGRSIWELYPEASESTFGAAYRAAMTQRVIRTTRDYYPPLATWFEATVYPTENGIAIYLRDVTADEQNRQELRAKTARLEEQAELLDSARDAIVVCRLDDSITYWNRGAEHLYGWTAREALGRSITDLLSMDAAAVDDARQTALRDGHWLGDLHQRSRDGRGIIADSRWQFVNDEVGEPLAIFALHSDVTAAREEQEHRIRAQRMESIGTLAGGIAHDLNNVLTPILMSAQLLAQLEHDADERALLAGIVTGARRGADMIRQVLSFAQGVEGERRPVRIAELLAELRTFCTTTLPSSIEVAIETQENDELWTVEGDPTQLLQVLVNLVTNARDAVGAAGTITIRAHNRTVPDATLSVGRLDVVGEYVVIEVADDGHGMHGEVAARVFEPFFTTKETGSGTGLGLPMSMSIVQSHRGHLRLVTEPGEGTTFEMLLPRAADAPEPPYQDAVVVPGGDGERILVIDDEESIRQIVSKTLAAHGYRVLTASNGREGIEVLESSGSPVDLVLTDMQMPVMDGAATAAYLAERHPEVVVIAASGLTAIVGAAHSSPTGSIPCIAKPFTTETLLGAVATALRSKRAAGSI